MENPESWKFLLVECGILGLEIRNRAVRIRNPSPTGEDLESSNWNAESTAWNPESKTVLDSLTWCDLLYLFSVGPRSTDTRLITTPVYNGQFRYFR